MESSIPENNVLTLRQCQCSVTGKPIQIKCLCIYKGVWSQVMTVNNYVMRCKRNGQLPGYGTVNGAGELNTATNMQWGNNRGAPSPTYWGCSTLLYAIKQGHHLSPGLLYGMIYMHASTPIKGMRLLPASSCNRDITQNGSMHEINGLCFCHEDT